MFDKVFLSCPGQLKMLEEGKMLKNWSDYLPAARVESRILSHQIEGDPTTGQHHRWFTQLCKHKRLFMPVSEIVFFRSKELWRTHKSNFNEDPDYDHYHG